MNFIRTHQLSVMLFLSGSLGILMIMTLLPKFMSYKRRSILALMEFASMMLLIFDRLSYLHRGDVSTYGGYMVRLSNGMCYFLMLLIVIPLCLETDLVLKLWLGVVPEHAVSFVQLTLVIATINVVNDTMIRGLHANGNLRKCMVVFGLLEFSIFPFSYVAFKLGSTPETAYYISTSVYFILMFVRVLMIKTYIGMTAHDYFNQVFLKLLMVTLPALIIPLILFILVPDSILRLIIISLVSFVGTSFFVFILGLTQSERTMIISVVVNKIHSFKNRKRHDVSNKIEEL